MSEFLTASQNQDLQTRRFTDIPLILSNIRGNTLQDQLFRVSVQLRGLELNGGGFGNCASHSSMQDRSRCEANTAARPALLKQRENLENQIRAQNQRDIEEEQRIESKVISIPQTQPNQNNTLRNALLVGGALALLL